MTSPLHKCWIDTSVLPSDILSLQNYDFFKVVERLGSDSIVNLLRVQAIHNVRVFMLVPDILAVLKLNASELIHIKNQVCFRLENNTYVVKCGVEASLRYLRELFAAKINEYYSNKQEEEEDDDESSTSSTHNATVGQKRLASSSSSDTQTANKRGRK